MRSNNCKHVSPESTKSFVENETMSLKRRYQKHVLQKTYIKQTIVSTRKVIGFLLIICSLGLGFIGVNKVSDNSASVEVLDLKLDVSNESGKQQGYIYLGLAVVLFIGGVYTLNKK